MLGELTQWIMNLEPDFAFLLALPFVVALTGFVAETVRNRKKARATTSRPHRPAGLAPNSHFWSRGS